MILQQIEVSNESVDARDVGDLPSTLGTEMEAQDGRQRQGTLMFVFPGREVDDVRIFEMPGVVEWLAVLHHRIPHVAYFLAPSLESGALQGLLLALASPEVRREAIETGQVPLNEEILEALGQHLCACARFAVSKGDDWELIVRRFIGPLGDTVQSRLVETVRETVD